MTDPIKLFPLSCIPQLLDIEWNIRYAFSITYKCIRNHLPAIQYSDFKQRFEISFNIFWTQKYVITYIQFNIKKKKKKKMYKNELHEGFNTHSSFDNVNNNGLFVSLFVFVLENCLEQNMQCLRNDKRSSCHSK